MSTSYLSQLLALQPPGRALPSSPESIWARLLAVPADSLERVENRTGDLVRESDPRDAIELLSDWERVCGLPGKCARPDTLNTVQARRAAVVNVLTRMGGQTMAWYIRSPPCWDLRSQLKNTDHSLPVFPAAENVSMVPRTCVSSGM